MKDMLTTATVRTKINPQNQIHINITKLSTYRGQVAGQQSFMFLSEGIYGKFLNSLTYANSFKVY